MELLNIYINKLTGSYAGGLLVVAARNEKEADEVCMNTKTLSCYWTYDDNSNKIHEWMEGYRKENFVQIPNAFYNGKPCVLAESHYIE